MPDTDKSGRLEGEDGKKATRNPKNTKSKVQGSLDVYTSGHRGNDNHDNDDDDNNNDVGRNNYDYDNNNTGNCGNNSSYHTDKIAFNDKKDGDKYCLNKPEKSKTEVPVEVKVEKIRGGEKMKSSNKEGKKGSEKNALDGPKALNGPKGEKVTDDRNRPTTVQKKVERRMHDTKMVIRKTDGKNIDKPEKLVMTAAIAKGNGGGNKALKRGTAQKKTFTEKSIEIGAQLTSEALTSVLRSHEKGKGNGHGPGVRTVKSHKNVFIESPELVDDEDDVEREKEDAENEKEVEEKEEEEEGEEKEGQEEEAATESREEADEDEVVKTDRDIEGEDDQANDNQSDNTKYDIGKFEFQKIFFKVGNMIHKNIKKRKGGLKDVKKNQGRETEKESNGRKEIRKKKNERKENDDIEVRKMEDRIKSDDSQHLNRKIVMGEVERAGKKAKPHKVNEGKREKRAGGQESNIILSNGFAAAAAAAALNTVWEGQDKDKRMKENRSDLSERNNNNDDHNDNDNTNQDSSDSNGNANNAVADDNDDVNDDDNYNDNVDNESDDNDTDDYNGMIAVREGNLEDKQENDQENEQENEQVQDNDDEEVSASVCGVEDEDIDGIDVENATQDGKKEKFKKLLNVARSLLQNKLKKIEKESRQEREKEKKREGKKQSKTTKSRESKIQDPVEIDEGISLPLSLPLLRRISQSMWKIPPQLISLSLPLLGTGGKEGEIRGSREGSGPNRQTHEREGEAERRETGNVQEGMKSVGDERLQNNEISMNGDSTSGTKSTKKHTINLLTMPSIWISSSQLYKHIELNSE